jgi:alkylated DNA repair dioxygenase AlkB
MRTPPSFACHDLDDENTIHTGFLPSELLPDALQFETLWQLHPTEYHKIKMHGRLVPTPRWQQAYGRDYHYTGRVNQALPMPKELKPLVAWAKDQIDGRLNGILLNWYDGKLGHYIGRHRDSRVNMVTGAPIVTMSLGEERTFRLRSWPSGRGNQAVDFETRNGAVFVMPFETNLAWTHEVPASKKRIGRRISITLRAFDGDQISEVP